MSRKSVLDVIRDIRKILAKEKELSVKAISKRIGSQWETTIKALEFLKEIGIVKERSGKKAYKTERLFTLNR